MKNKLFLMIMVVMVCSLTACGQQETETMTNTGNSIEPVSYTHLTLPTKA